SYELFCYERWFLINELCKRDPRITSFLCLDSDVMLFCDVTKEAQKFVLYDFTLTLYSGHICYIKNHKVLEGLIDFMIELYKNIISVTILKGEYHRNKLNGINAGISDMCLLIYYANYIGIDKVAFLHKPIESSLYDINIHNHFASIFKIERGVLYKIDKKSKSKMRFNALHLQGENKKYIKQLYEIDENNQSVFLPPSYSTPEIKNTLLFEIKTKFKKIQKRVKKILHF
ncbi:MAG: hypothetical protein WCF95_02835, partial [bacterium]